jgi:hypothetical protein
MSQNPVPGDTIVTFGEYRLWFGNVVNDRQGYCCTLPYGNQLLLDPLGEPGGPTTRYAATQLVVVRFETMVRESLDESH